MIKDWILSLKISLKSKQNIDHWMSVSALKPLLSAQVSVCPHSVRNAINAAWGKKQLWGTFAELKNLSVKAFKFPLHPALPFSPSTEGKSPNGQAGSELFWSGIYSAECRLKSFEYLGLCWVPENKHFSVYTCLVYLRTKYSQIRSTWLSIPKLDTLATGQTESLQL